MADEPNENTEDKYSDNWLENEKNGRKFFLRKALVECCFVILIIVAICWLSYNKIIGGETVAALLGGIIGYTLEYWRKKN